MIRPKLLYGSKRLSKSENPNRNRTATITRTEYLNILPALTNLSGFCSKNRFLSQEITSCKVPSGQTLEQYIRPKINVRIKNNRKPKAERPMDPINFRSEGTNCGQVIALIKDAGIHWAGSRKISVVRIRKIRETTTLMVLSQESLCILNLNPVY
jgi:hypothetical protein